MIRAHDRRGRRARFVVVTVSTFAEARSPNEMATVPSKVNSRSVMFGHARTYAAEPMLLDRIKIHVSHEFRNYKRVTPEHVKQNLLGHL
jgi:hypothetical protein